MANQYLSIDIGGSSIKYGILDASGTIISRFSVSRPNNLGEFKQWFQETIERYAETIRGIGVCCPGKVNSESTLISNGGAAPYLDGVILKSLLPTQCNLPLSIENDAKAATLAEMWLGNLKDVRNGAAIILGTSIGGGIVINNQLLVGDHLQAGEIGYMFTDNHANTAKEQLAGFNTSAVKMVSKINQLSKNPDLSDGQAAFDNMRQIKEARYIFEQYCRKIAKIIFSMNSVIDVSTIIIGGGISAQDCLISEINKQYDKITEEIPVIARRIVKPRIVAAKFRSEANLYGAAYNLLLDIDRHSGTDIA